MIRNVIIPDHIGSYYLFSKRIVAIDIGLTEIHATVCLAKGKKRIIEQLIEEKIDSSVAQPYEDRVIQALQNLKSKLKSYDKIVVAISSSSVIFKELSLPLIGKKIDMVVPFEVESLLPFSIDDAVIDNIVTKSDAKEKQSEVLVAAVKKEYINHVVGLFEKAGISVDQVTVDMFELYGLYTSIPSLYAQSGTVALIDLTLSATRLAVIIGGQLKYIRVLPKGLLSIAKKIALTNGSDTHQSLDYMLRFGIGTADHQNEELQNNLHEALCELFQELEFTIHAYTKKVKTTDEQSQVYLTGAGADVPGIKELCQKCMHTNSEIFHIKKILHNGLVESKISSIPNRYLVSVATALSSPLTEDFNLYRPVAKEEKLLKNQLIALGAIILLAFGSFAVYSYMRVRHMRALFDQGQNESINDLKKLFPKLGAVANLTQANQKAMRELKKQESAWQKLSVENRYAMLSILSQLSKCINLKESQLTLTGLEIKDGTVKLYGSVPGYPQLIALQNQLKCPLFKPIAKLQEINFKADPIILTVNSKES